MSTSRYFNRICAAITVLCLAVTVMLYFPDKIGIQAASNTLAYEAKLFDTSYVHSIDIVMDDWDSFIDSCENEEYAACAVVIDGESYKNVAVRAKGNTSLSSVAAYENDRYSFKLEFDHYNDQATYHGLDKLCLNNIIQDNTYMKDYLCYTMMNYAGASSPLCSFAFITVNGKDWGLYLAIEAVEDSFLERNYSSTGNLYKPDSTNMGGGRGNGKDFKQENIDIGTSDTTDSSAENTKSTGADFGNFGGKNGKGGFGGMGSNDVKLVYTDDEFDSYSNIFSNAKTDITNANKTRLIDSLKILSSDDAASTVDTDAVIKYFAVHNFVCNFDSYTGSMIHNYYLYENDGILSMIPWDYNLAFSSFMGGGDSTSMINFPIDSPVSGGDTDSRPMIAWIFADDEYTELYHKTLSDFIAGYFESGYFEEEIERVSSLISPYVEKDPTKFCTYDEFTAGVSALKEFCTLRAESVRGQLDGTIPATTETQSSDSSALISGSSVSISTMGSMGHGMGEKGEMKNGGFGAPPQMPDNSNGQIPNFGETPPELPSGNSPFGDMPQSEQSGEGTQPAPTDEAAPEQSTNDNTTNSDTSDNAAENSDSAEGSPDRTDETVTSSKQFGGMNNSNENNVQSPPQMSNDSSSSSAEFDKALTLLCISIGALLAAILFTKIFRDRN